MTEFRRRLATVLAVCLTGLLMAMTACTPQQQASVDSTFGNLERFANSPNAVSVAGPSSASVGLPGIQQTPLYRLFDNYPYDTNQSFDGQYPRVALTVVSGPPNHGKLWQWGPSTGYWVLTARIWRSPTQSENVGPFTVQIQRDGPHDERISTLEFQYWLGYTPTEFVAGQGSTGTLRTDGPMPPANPVPNDPASVRYYGEAMGSFEPQSNDGLMFDIVLNTMDFNANVPQDRWVWITKFVPAETAGL